MQVDIITKKAVILKAADTEIISVSSDTNEIHLQLVIKSAGIEKLYTLSAGLKHCKGQPEIKTRLE